MELTPPNPHPILFPSGSVDILFKDDLTVVILLGVSFMLISFGSNSRSLELFSDLIASIRGSIMKFPIAPWVRFHVLTEIDDIPLNHLSVLTCIKKLWV